jgi:carbon-monoxide dehydrogenase medium subunit
MLSKEFAFLAPTTLDEAVALLAEHGEGTKVIAGGMSLMPAMNLGLTRPDVVVSLNHVASMDYVSDDGDALRIGAMTRHARIVSDPLVRAGCPLLAEAARHIGDVQVRHRGTIGGSLAHADPAADYLPVVVALDATLRLRSAAGERTVSARELVVDVMRTVLEPGELVVEVRVPKHTGGAYLRLARVEGSFAIVNVAAILNGRGALAVGGATAPPALVHLEQPLDAEAVGEAAYAACEDAYGDLSGPGEYRREMARVYARRAIEAATNGGR